jgi:hypothetical protein
MKVLLLVLAAFIAQIPSAQATGCQAQAESQEARDLSRLERLRAQREERRRDARAESALRYNEDRSRRRTGDSGTLVE